MAELGIFLGAMSGNESDQSLYARLAGVAASHK